MQGRVKIRYFVKEVCIKGFVDKDFVNKEFVDSVFIDVQPTSAIAGSI